MFKDMLIGYFIGAAVVVVVSILMYIKNKNLNKHTDIELFFDTYKRLGIELIVTTGDMGYKHIFLGEGKESHFTESILFGVVDRAASHVIFNSKGEFVGQEFFTTFNKKE